MKDFTLESTGYRHLFEYIQMMGIDLVYGLVEDIHNLPSFDDLIQQTIIDEESSLERFLKNNKKVLAYFKQHRDSFEGLNFTSKSLWQVVSALFWNLDLLNCYLENAKKLEDLKVAKINFISRFDRSYQCGIYRNENGEVFNILKYYTDGIVCPEEERVVDKEFGYSEIPFSLSKPSFLLMANNSENFNFYKEIYITNFAFDGSKLPSFEETESYNIPRHLIKK